MSRKPFWYIRRKAVASEVDEELNLHLDLRIAELTRQGLPPDEARREALRQFGDLERTRQYCRRQDEEKESHVQRTLLFQDLLQDLRISLRSLIRVPVLTLTIVATVGLGIGATTAIFSAINAALIKPLPYADPDRLVRIYTDTPPFRFRFSVVDYQALVEQQTQFSHTATYTDRSVTYSDGTTAELLRCRVVSWQYFALLGIRPAMGRDFTEGDGRLGSPPVVIASRGFWQQRLGGRPDAIGKMIRFDGADYELAGVLPNDVGPLESRQDLFLIQQFQPPRRKGPFFWTAIARLKDGVDPAVAQSELTAINKRLFPIWKSSYQDDKATWTMIDLKSHIVGNVSTTAGLALTAVALVWLIACANASNLLIARVTSRRRELAVRSALGASRGRVTRHLLAESAVLAIGSVIVGVGLAWVGMDLFRGVGATYFPRMSEIAFDAPVLWLLLGLTVTSGVLFGLIPAVYGSGGPTDESMRAGGRASTGNRGARQLRRVLVGSQFAIATPLLIVAGLLLASLNEMKNVDLGFDSQNLITGSIRHPPVQQGDEGRLVSFWTEVQSRIEALPGVTGVGFADGLPPNNVGNQNNFDLEELPATPGRSQPVTPWVASTPDYFRVLGLKLLEGRLLDLNDAQAGNPPSVVVDSAWARRFFPNQSAIGKRFRSGGCTNCPWTSVVGVVSDVKYAGLDKPDNGTVYTPMPGDMVTRFIVIRTQTDPLSLVSSVRETIRGLEPSAPLSSVATVDALVEQSLQRPQSLSILVAAFALAALVLAAVGIYGVMAYYVQQHMKEISIRMALGGSSADVLKLVVGQGMTVVAGGVVLGLLAAFGLTRLMSSLLFGVGAADPLTFAAVAAVLLTVALTASFVPARRAVAVQPAEVLRNE
jgi:putative ABC transport system permease protein